MIVRLPTAADLVSMKMTGVKDFVIASNALPVKLDLVIHSRSCGFMVEAVLVFCWLRVKVRS
jgi:hypothetical protein